MSVSRTTQTALTIFIFWSINMKSIKPISCRQLVSHQNISPTCLLVYKHPYHNVMYIPFTHNKTIYNWSRLQSDDKVSKQKQRILPHTHTHPHTPWQTYNLVDLCNTFLTYLLAWIIIYFKTIHNSMYTVTLTMHYTHNFSLNSSSSKIIGILQNFQLNFHIYIHGLDHKKCGLVI